MASDCRDVEEVVTDLDQCAQPIEEGQPSPFTGQLLTTALAVDLYRQIQSLEFRADMAEQYLTERLELETQHHRRREDILRESHSSQVETLTARITQLESRPTFQRGLIIGLIVGGSLIALASIGLGLLLAYAG